MKTTGIPEIARRTLNVFFVIDTSGSMAGEAIAQVNMGISDAIETLKREGDTADAQLKIAVLEFNSGATWYNPAGPQDLEDFMFTAPLEAGGLTDMGAALKELDSKLSRNAYLDSIAGNYLPVIIFLSDGYPTDNYLKELDNIRNNKWFSRATKIAIGVGSDPDMTMLANVSGNVENCLKVGDLSMLARVIKFASVTSSMVQSQSRVSSTEQEIAGIIDEITGENGVQGVQIGEIDTETYVPQTPAADTTDPDNPWDEDWK